MEREQGRPAQQFTQQGGSDALGAIGEQQGNPDIADAAILRSVPSTQQPAVAHHLPLDLNHQKQHAGVSIEPLAKRLLPRRRGAIMVCLQVATLAGDGVDYIDDCLTIRPVSQTDQGSIPRHGSCRLDSQE